ncbi:MAG: hypothetical protein ACREBI_02435 [Nitrosotalea sp.]
MDEKQFDVLAKKLDSITKLLAFSLVKDKSVNEQVEMLTKAGLRAADIAALLDKTENQIYVTQTTLRKKKKESNKETGLEQQTSEGGPNV